jgi:hypothetical protein
LRTGVDAAIGSPVDIEIFGIRCGHPASFGHELAGQLEIARLQTFAAFAGSVGSHGSGDTTVDFVETWASEIGSQCREHRDEGARANQSQALLVARHCLVHRQRPLPETERHKQ